MKKIRCVLCWILALLLAQSSSFYVVASTTQKIISQGDFDFTILNGEAHLKKYYHSDILEVVIPTEVEGYPVVSVQDEVFRGVSGLQSVVIGEGVQSIGNRAFYNCPDLETVMFPDSLVSIGEMAFCNTGLTAVELPKNLQSFDVSAFQNCVALKSLKINQENPFFTSVDNVVFTKDMKTLVYYPNFKEDATYQIPVQVTTIGERAFSGSRLQNVQFPAELQYIEKSAFANCQNLRQIQIPDGIQRIDVLTFKDCTALTNVTLGTGLEELPRLCFSGCSNLQTVILPEGVSKISSACFSGTVIQNITIPDSLEILENYAFQNAQVGSVRFYSLAQQERLVDQFPLSNILCLCHDQHTYDGIDRSICSVCGYSRNLSVPPVLLEKTYESVKLQIQEGMEYSYDLVNWRTDGVFADLLPNHPYRFYARASAVGEVPAGQASDPLLVVTDKVPQQKAPRPVVQTRSDDEVTLLPVPGCEYSMDGITWQKSSVFSNLQPDLDYTFYQRYAATDILLAGQMSDPIVSPAVGVFEITSAKYTVSGEIIRKIPIGTTVKALLSNLGGGHYCVVYQGENPISADKLVGTGMTVKLMYGQTVRAVYTVIVTGDVNGDGKITITDMLAMKAHILKKTLLSGVYLQAADTSGEGKITITDFLQVKGHILRKSTITAN